METLYKVKTKNIVLNSLTEKIKLWCFGDVHRFTRSCDEDRWKWFLQKAKATMDKNTYFIGLGDYCMPLDTSILTMEGWKQYHQLRANELVCGYNQETDCLEWQPLTGVYISPLQKLYRMKSKSFDFRCTSEHGWFSHNGSKKIKKTAFKDLRSQYFIRVSAPLYDQKDIDYLDVTPHECYMLGWIVTDGCINRKDENNLNVNITQSPKKYLNQLKEVFSGEYTACYQSPVCDCQTINIKTSIARKLFKKFGFKSKDDLPLIVTRLNKECRIEMLKAFHEAEGWMEDRWCFGQLEGGVLEAYRILTTLEGIRIGLSFKRQDGLVTHKESSRRNVTFYDLRINEEGEEAVWCPITPLSSIIARQGACITITGNCNFASTKEQQALHSGVHADTIEDFDDIVKKRNRVMSAEMSFMKPNLLGLIDGNHNWTFKNGTTATEDLADRLGAEYLGWLCHYTLRIQFSYGKSSKNINIYILACHGKAGGKTAGASVNQLDDASRIFPMSDLIIMGHDHQRLARPIDILIPVTDTHTGEVHIKQKRQFLIRSGSFKKAYTVDTTGYEVGRLLRPADLGASFVEIGFHRDQKDGRENIITDISTTI